MASAMIEHWRPIPSIPDHLASSEGRILRLPFVGRMPHGGFRLYDTKPLVGQWDGSRYLYVFRGKTYKVHRLVCEAFHRPAPFPNAVVMHDNEDASVNRANNLSWGTQKENLNAPGFLAYCRGRTGANNPFLKGRTKA